MKLSVLVRFWILGLVLSSWSVIASAQETHVLLTPQELEIQDRARKRLYPGGVDEQNLKVQQNLNQVTKSTFQEPAVEESAE